LVSHPKPKGEGVRKQSAEDNIWKYEAGNNMRIEKITQVETYSFYCLKIKGCPWHNEMQTDRGVEVQ
jgi:hypothetical protein